MADNSHANRQVAKRLLTPPADGNQCDGCRAGLVLRNGIHYDMVRLDVRSAFSKIEEQAVMGCTRDRYKA